MNIAKVKTLIPAPEAVLYYITSSVSSIRADENGTPVTPTQPIVVSEWKKVGATAAVLSRDLKMTLYYVKGGVETYFGQEDWSPTVTFYAAMADGCDSIVAKLFDASGNLVRSLAIPVEWQGKTGKGGKDGKDGKDGEDGEDGVTYEILPSVSHISADANGTIRTGVIEVSAYKIEGKSRTSCGVDVITAIGASGETSPYYWVQYRINGGDWTDCSRISYGSEMYTIISYGVPASAVSTITSGIAFRLCYGTGSSSYSVVHEIAPLLVVKDGQTGIRGKTGRWYYYDGYFDSTKEYTATDNQAPYVAFDWTDTVTVNGANTQVVKTSCYMLVATTNKSGSTYIAPRTTAAAGVWELMEASFKWLISEAIFTAFAKLGSWVFNGDYMLSQHGPAGNDYQNFEPGNLNAWIPNCLFNAKDGSGWVAGGNLEWDSKGNVRLAGLTYRKKTVITQETLSYYMSVVETKYDNDGNVVNIYALDVTKAGNWIVLDGIQPGVYIKLPSLRYDGTYTDAEKDLARSLVGCSLIISNTNNTYLCGFRNTHMIYYSEIDVHGERYCIKDGDANEDDMFFSNKQTVYLECVLSDSKNDAGIYMEDIFWIARCVKK